MKAHNTAARKIVQDMERVSPYLYEGLYGSFLRSYMKSDRSRWTKDLSRYLGTVNKEWDDISDDIATILWDRFESRISC